MIDEHSGFMFHYEVHSSCRKGAWPALQWFSAPQIGSNKLKR